MLKKRFMSAGDAAFRALIIPYTIFKLFYDKSPSGDQPVQGLVLVVGIFFCSIELVVLSICYFKFGIFGLFSVLFGIMVIAAIYGFINVWPYPADGEQ